jgi:hypothetical protein
MIKQIKKVCKKRADLFEFLRDETNKNLLTNKNVNPIFGRIPTLGTFEKQN